MNRVWSPKLYQPIFTGKKMKFLISFLSFELNFLSFVRHANILSSRSILNDSAEMELLNKVNYSQKRFCKLI